MKRAALGKRSRPDVAEFMLNWEIYCAQFERGEIEWEAVYQRLQAWNAHAAHGDTWKLREQIFNQYPFMGKKRK